MVRRDLFSEVTNPTLWSRLREGPGEWCPLENFSPLSQCLEWRLASQYWDVNGPAAFFGGDVPYVSINDGRLSADAARLLVEIKKATSTGSIDVIELGGGSGLFAKLFLDELRIQSPSVYARTTYVWTDASPSMIHQAGKSGLFSDHPGRVETAVLPVPGMRPLPDKFGGGFDLVIANYLLDNLPATVLRLTPGRVEELEVRATLRADLDPSRLGGCDAQTWSERALKSGGNDPGLVDLYPWFSLECRYRPVKRSTFRLGMLIPEPDSEKTVLWSHHETAWTWLQEMLSHVKPGGGVLVNDYGHRPLLRAAGLVATQHYGGTLAHGINFDEMEMLPLLEPDWQVVAPETESKQVHSRWISRRVETLPASIFQLIFDGRRRDRVLELIDQAAECADKGRTEEARWLYWQAHETSPRCWHVLERWAVFCLTRLKDPDTALALAEMGLSLHHRYPPLWNTKGDALYELKRIAEAGDCFRQTMEINPREVRGRLNLAYVHLHEGNHAAALQILAEALALDKQGNFRDALLQKQQEVLQQIALETRDSLSLQLNRFRNHDAPPPLAPGDT